MARTEIKCLCGHANHYDLESPTKFVYVCVDPPGTKQFVKTPNPGLMSDYHIWMCPVCGTLKGVRMNTK